MSSKQTGPDKTILAPSSALSTSISIRPSPSRVVVHPLVLLSVVDHFTRMRKLGHNKRVVGVLLGALKNPASVPGVTSSSSSNETGLVLDISNSFAVPFDEDDHDNSVWFLDHDYLENMYSMFKKVNARERVVGWYHTGPKLRANDLAINEVLRKYNSNAVLVVVDVEPKLQTLPTEAYIAVDQINEDGTPASQTFNHLPSEIGAEEAEEVGVEHLLREVKNASAGTLSQHMAEQLYGLAGLGRQLTRIAMYLRFVHERQLPINHQINLLLQHILNLLPDLALPNFQHSLTLWNNDSLEVMYVCALVRAIISLHSLINNKLSYRDAEKDEGDKGREKDEENKDKSSGDKDREAGKGQEEGGKDSKKDAKKSGAEKTGGGKNDTKKQDGTPGSKSRKAAAEGVAAAEGTSGPGPQSEQATREQLVCALLEAMKLPTRT